MQAFIYLLALLPASAFATLYGHCSGTATGVYKSDGICDYTSDCNNRGGSHISGGCPFDGNSITCCQIGLADVSKNPCGGSSYCTWRANGCPNGGSFVVDHCPGGDNYSCCKH